MYNNHLAVFQDAGVPEEFVVPLTHCSGTQVHNGAMHLVGLGALTETFLTGTPLLDGIGALIQIENVDWRWLIDGVVQDRANWLPADRRHVIEGGCALHVKGPAVFEGPVFADNISGSGATEDITNATITEVTTIASGDQILIRDVDDSNTLKYVEYSDLSVAADEYWITDDGGTLRHLIPHDKTTHGDETTYYVGMASCGLAVDHCGHVMGWWNGAGTWQSPHSFAAPSGGQPSWNSGITTY